MIENTDVSRTSDTQLSDHYPPLIITEQHKLFHEYSTSILSCDGVLVLAVYVVH